MRESNENEYNSGSEFIRLFLKLFKETKYNLQSLNKRLEYIEKCMNNAFLLDSNEPFDEEVENEEDQELVISQAEINMLAKNFLEEEEEETKMNINKNININDKNKEGKKNRKDSSSSSFYSNKDNINQKVNPEQKVMKYSEFLKMKQKQNNNTKEDNKSTECNKYISHIQKNDKQTMIGNKRSRK